MNIEELVKALNAIRVQGLRVRATYLSRGRIRETVHLRVDLVGGGAETTILFLTVFQGRGSLYRPWIEAYGFKKVLRIGGSSYVFPGSKLEEAILNALSETIGAGERLFIEYLYDEETQRALELGAPAATTRLGYLLYRRGFLWFKDWYFPEGFMEGGPKLQAEKPISREHAERLRSNLVRELLGFIREWGGTRDAVMSRAVERARIILAELGAPTI